MTNRSFRSRSLRSMVFTAALLAIVLAITWKVPAQEAMQVIQNAPGFKPEMRYADFGKGENVNAFTGGLVVSHSSAISLPQNLGKMLTPMRVYNSKSEDKFSGVPAVVYGPYYGWLGAGWTLSFGRVFVRLVGVPGQGGSVPRQQFFYADESGAEHRLYLNCPNLNVGTTCGYEPYTGGAIVPTPDTWYMTNDASYIRARYTEGANGGTWSLFFPDGSTRILGGTYAYLAPDQDPTTKIIKNKFQQGWYTTSMTDRAGNVIAILYRVLTAGQPFMGSIDTITDQMGRAISFTVFAPGTGPSGLFGGLLQKISYMGSAQGKPVTVEENYTYATYTFGLLNGSTVMPSLIQVTDPEQLQTLYHYSTFVSPLHPAVPIGPCLYRIDYPTGATSTYSYSSWEYIYQGCPRGALDCETNRDDMDGVEWHKEYSDRGDTTDNVAT